MSKQSEDEKAISVIETVVPIREQEDAKSDAISTDDYYDARVDQGVTEDSSLNEFGHGKGNILTAYFNVVCVVAGTGTLGLPKAFAVGGWLGILTLLLAHAMAVYSGIVLIRCLYYKPGQRLHDIKGIGTAAFGRIGYLVASVLHLLIIFGSPALYLVLAGSNMHELLTHTVRSQTPLLCSFPIAIDHINVILSRQSFRNQYGPSLWVSSS